VLEKDKGDRDWGEYLLDKSVFVGCLRKGVMAKGYISVIALIEFLR